MAVLLTYMLINRFIFLWISEFKFYVFVQKLYLMTNERKRRLTIVHNIWFCRFCGQIGMFRLAVKCQISESSTLEMTECSNLVLKI